MSLGRDAFGYMEPSGLPGANPYYAQCGVCRFWRIAPLPGRCALFGPTIPVRGADSCNLFVPGTADGAAVRADVTPAEAGFVRRAVQCQRCRFYAAGDAARGRCRLFAALNASETNVFDLDPAVKAEGCCNAQLPR